MKRLNMVPLVFLVALMLPGCGKTAVDVTTIAIQKDGTIEHTVVEEFGEESVDALQSLMQEKAAAYNNSYLSGESGIEVADVEAGEGTVKVTMTYPNAEAFDGFMNMDVMAVDSDLRAPFFYDTVEDAYMQGFDLEVELRGVEDEAVLQGKDDILLQGKNKLIIYDNAMNLGAPVQIHTQEKPLYISVNVTVAGKNLLEISDTDEPAYILLEG